MSAPRSEQAPSYPPADAARKAGGAFRGAPIAHVEPYSPADDAGFTSGCFITAVDGHPVRDVIDWRWLSADDVMEVSYVDADGDAGVVELVRDEGEDWGFDFDGLVFDDVIQCKNACTFCFMHQLPKGLRPSLTLRDDDFRLSFLVGTFVTLTNLSAQDEARIVDQRISPLHVSLQAADPQVRRRIIGKNAQHGLDAFERLLAAGVRAHTQIVLVPGQNDGAVLRDTLAWAWRHPGILDVGIVPLGYTRYQTRFDHSFNSVQASAEVLSTIMPFQRRAMDERGHAWVFAADEFYSNAYGPNLVQNLPPTSFYGDFELFEDGIGIVRSTVDDWNEAVSSGIVARAGQAALKAHARVRMIAGLAQKNFLDALVRQAGIGAWFSPLYVKNRFFGGNVDVTGLLVGADIADAVLADRAAYAAQNDGTPHVLYAVPRVVLNDDGVLLDDMNVQDMESAAGCRLHVVSCNPTQYFMQFAQLIEGATAS